MLRTTYQTNMLSYPAACVNIFRSLKSIICVPNLTSLINVIHKFLMISDDRLSYLTESKTKI